MEASWRYSSSVPLNQSVEAEVCLGYRTPATGTPAMRGKFFLRCFVLTRKSALRIICKAATAAPRFVNNIDGATGGTLR